MLWSRVSFPRLRLQIIFFSAPVWGKKYRLRLRKTACTGTNFAHFEKSYFNIKKTFYKPRFYPQNGKPLKTKTKNIGSGSRSNLRSAPAPAKKPRVRLRNTEYNTKWLDNFGNNQIHSYGFGALKPETKLLRNYGSATLMFMLNTV